MAVVVTISAAPTIIRHVALHVAVVIWKAAAAFLFVLKRGQAVLPVNAVRLLVLKAALGATQFIAITSLPVFAELYWLGVVNDGLEVKISEDSRLFHSPYSARRRACSSQHWLGHWCSLWWMFLQEMQTETTEMQLTHHSRRSWRAPWRHISLGTGPLALPGYTLLESPCRQDC